MQKFQRGHDEMGRAIAIRGFELKDDLAGRGAAQAFVAEGGARDVATVSPRASFQFVLSCISCEMPK